MRPSDPLRRTRAALVGVVAAALLASAPAPAADPAPEAVRQARERWREGVAAYDAGRWEAARVAFAQVWALQQHPAVLRNLGQAELKRGLWLDAARHLARYLRDGSPTAAERTSAERSLADATAHLGRIAVDVPVVGAEVRVDGDLAGRAPLEEAWLVEPGRHLVRANRDGWKETLQSVDVAPGAVVRVSLAPAALDPATPAAATPAAAVASSEPSAPSSAPAPAPARDAPRAAASPSARTVVVASAAGGALVATGLAVAFALKSSHDADEVARLRGALPPSACLDAANAGACDDLTRAHDAHGRDRTIAIVSGVAGGALAVSAVAAAWLWPRAEARAARLAPFATKGAAGVALGGEF